MITKKMFLTVLIVILVSVLHCNGDVCSCTCCTGNFCTPTFQGTVAVSSCASASCRSICQSKYPTQCTDVSNFTIHQCESDSFPTPDWSGIFDVARQCDATACCCPVGQVVFWRVSQTTMRIQLLLIGPGCNGSTYFDTTTPVPLEFAVQGQFFGQLVQVKLSQNSRTIQLNNPGSPTCSEIGTRHEPEPEPEPVSLGTIHLASVFLLICLTSFRQLIL